MGGAGFAGRRGIPWEESVIAAVQYIYIIYTIIAEKDFACRVLSNLCVPSNELSGIHYPQHPASV